MDKLSQAIISLEAHFADKNEHLRSAWDIVHAELEVKKLTPDNTQSKPCSGWAVGDGCGSGGRCGDKPCIF